MKRFSILATLVLFTGAGNILDAQPKSFAVLTPKQQTVTAAALSPDGKRLYAGTGNEKTTGTCELQFWDAVTGRLERSVPMTFHWMAAVAVSADGKYVACGGANAPDVKVFNTTTGELVTTLGGHGGAQAIAFHADGKRLAVGGDDRAVRIWDVTTGELKLKMEGHLSWVGSLSFRDARHLASGSDKEIRFWDANSGRSRGILKGHDSVVTALVHSVSGNLLFSAGRDKTVRVWDMNSHKEIHVFRGHTQEVLGLTLSKDGKTLFSAAGDCFRADQKSEVKRWDVAARKLDHEWLGPMGRVHLLTLADNERLLGVVGGGFDNRGLPLPTDWTLYNAAGREP